MRLRISVCIPTVRPATVAAAIRSVLAQDEPAHQVLVVGQGDRGLLEPAALDAAAGDGRMRYLHLARCGLSRARNAAVLEARGDVVAFLDDDCEAASDWLRELAAGFARRGDVGVVGGAVVAPPPLRRPSSCPRISPAEALYDPAAMPGKPPPGWDWMGANVALRVDVLRRIGRWDECLGAGAAFPAGEDTDYKLRLEAAGVVMVSTPAAVVRHTAGTRYGRDVLRSQRAYALGNGALAGKLTLLGDARGPLWRSETRRGSLGGWLRTRRPLVLPKDLRRLWYFERGYRRCLHDYAVGSEGLLCDRGSAVRGTAAVPSAEG